MDLRKKTNPFVENAKESEFRRAAARRQQKSDFGTGRLALGKTAARKFKERYKTKQTPKLRPGDIGSGIAGSYNR